MTTATLSFSEVRGEYCMSQPLLVSNREKERNLGTMAGVDQVLSGTSTLSQ